MARDDVIVIETPGGGGFGKTVTRPPRHACRLAFASIAGTALEYYDFAVYNTLAALVFNKLFFPSFDPLAGTHAVVRHVLRWAIYRGPSAACCSVISAIGTGAASCW